MHVITGLKFIANHIPHNVKRKMQWFYQSKLQWGKPYDYTTSIKLAGGKRNLDIVYKSETSNKIQSD